MLPAVLAALLVLPWLMTARPRSPRALPVPRWTAAPVAVPHRTPADPDDWVLPSR